MNLNKLVLILFLSSSIFAQDIGTTRVKVLEGYRPSIAEAVKLNENANFEDTLKRNKAQLYEFIDADLESQYITKPLSAAKVKDEKISDLYSTKVSGALGSAWLTRASVVHNNAPSVKFSYGLIADHFSNRYYLAKNNDNSISLYSKKITSTNIFVANLSYKRKTFLYYNDESDLEDFLFINRYAYSNFSVSASSKIVTDDKLKHHTVFFISDLNEFSENQICLKSNLRKNINGTQFILDVNFDNYLRYNNLDSDIESVDFQSLYFSPKTSLSRYGLDFDLGFDIDLKSGASASFFPVFKLTKELVTDVLFINGGLQHKKQINSLKLLFDMNPYIHSFGTNQSILRDSIVLQKFEITDTHHWFFNMRNRLGWQDILDLGLSYGKIKNFAHFIPVDYLDYHRFQVAYLDVNQLHISAKYDRRFNEIINLNLEVDYFNWDKTVYYSPYLTAKMHVPINLRGKIKINPSMSFMAKREVLDEYVTEIPSRLHVNIDLHYFYSQQLSAYMELNNISNSKQDIWLGYREIGFNVALGMNFSF